MPSQARFPDRDRIAGPGPLLLYLRKPQERFSNRDCGQSNTVGTTRSNAQCVPSSSMIALYSSPPLP